MTSSHFRPFTNAVRVELHDHVEALAAEYGVRWIEEGSGWPDAEADLDERWFRSPILRSDLDYLTALHEIGHLVLGLLTEDYDGRILFSNGLEVWRWAIENSLITAGDDARSQIIVAFQSHSEEVGPTRAEIDELKSLLGTQRSREAGER